jgi:hypothetical protein
VAEIEMNRGIEEKPGIETPGFFHFTQIELSKPLCTKQKRTNQSESLHRV